MSVTRLFDAKSDSWLTLPVVLPSSIQWPHATYGTQFGTIERPTHRNTPQDQAMFEVCGHVFADLSEPAYGVSLMCANKYGYGIEGNTMRYVFTVRKVSHITGCRC